ncbi:hypothetical protein [Halopolyspora algeriensis]|nr:hypothetical protein [Halopolyspora algeriensis]
MSSPGGPGWDGYRHGPGQYVDPVTGQPPERNASSGHGPGPADQGHPRGPSPWGSPGTQQDFGGYERARPQQPSPGIVTGYPPPEPPRRNRTPWTAGIAAAATAVLAIVTTVVLTGGSDSGNSAPANLAAPAPSEAENPAGRPSSSAPTTTDHTTPAPTTEDMRHPVIPVVAGWQGMALPEFDIAYDIPPGWEPETGSISGFETDSGRRVTMSGYSSYKRDFCTEADLSFRARVGLTGTDEKNPVVAAEKSFREWARLGWGTNTGALPPVSMNPVKSVKIHRDRIDAKLVSGTITPADPGPCSPPSVFVSILAIAGNGDHSAALMIGIADQDVPGAVPPADINRSLTSVRWLPN